MGIVEIWGVRNSTVLREAGAMGKIKVDKSAVGAYSFGIK